MVQIDLIQLWPIVPVILIPIFLYFVKLEMRVRKVEELEGKLALEFRVQKLESDPVFNAFKQIKPGQAVDLYRATGGTAT